MKKAIVPVIVLVILVVAVIIGKNKKDENKTKGVKLLSSSGAAMTAALEDAISRKEWIVVTGWTPHWKFARWELKYLKDPKGIYGEKEEIRTIARKGLKKDMPEVYKVIDAFSWTPADMEGVMVKNTKEDADPYETAKEWVNSNPDKVNKWLEGVEVKDYGYEVKIANVAWATEIASSNVIKAVLQEKLGCKVKVNDTSAGIMYEAVASGDQDFLVGAWLPTTQKAYYEKLKSKFDDLGPNLVGTKIGLVVPAYVTIDSIGEIADNADKFKNTITGIDPGAGIMKTTKTVIEKYGL
jgi:glycine betaine/proline transport system substrate-binding protein